MMRQATMTIIGLYNWDSTLFDGMHLPDEVERDDFIDELLSMAGGQNVLYPDFDLMKRLITTWSGRRLASWRRIAKALNSEYDPIHNYDRYEDYTDTRDLTGSDDETRDLSAGGTETRNLKNDVTAGSTEKVASYDSDLLQPRTGSISTGSNTDTGTVTVANTDKGTVKRSTTDKGTIKHEAHLYGNIGVTTTQQMINEEIGLRKTDLVELIIGEFIGRFCLDVYN